MPGAGRPVGLVVPGLLLLGAAVRALPFGGPFHLASYWDETAVAVPSIQVLSGEFPANATQEYFGSAPSHVLAAWFAVAGPTSLANDIFAYVLSLLILWTSWLVLRRFLDRPAALLGLAVLAVPPLFVTQWSFTTAGNHPVVLVLGNLCLLATYRIFVEDRDERHALLGLGLLAGLGWWTSPLSVVYLAPFGILALRTGLVWRPRIALFVIGILVGGLPEWIYELWYFPSARFALQQAGGVAVLPLRERVAHIGGFLATIVGFQPQTGRWWIAAFLVVAAPLWLAVLGRAAVRDHAELGWMLGLHGRLDRGQVILWIVVATNLALVLVTHRAIDHYYLLPLCSVLPCWAGEALSWIHGRSQLVAGAALAGLLALNVWTNWQGTLGSTDAGRIAGTGGRRWVALERRIQPLLRWLEDRGLDRVYLTETPYTSTPLGERPHLQSFGVTYLSGRRVILADPWRDRIVSHSRLVDAAAGPPFVAVEPEAGRLRAGLQAIGMDVRETEVAGLHVLESTPRFAGSFAPLPRTHWTVSASDHAEEAVDLVDGDAATGWASASRQQPGQWLAVDLGAPELVTRVDLLAIDWQNVPAGLRVEASLDGQHWNTVSEVPDYWGPLFFSEHHAFLKVRRGRVQAIFPPVRAQHVRFVQTGIGPRSWAARELFVYGPGGARPPLPRPGELTAALRHEGIDFVYANHWLSAWVRVDSRGAIGALDGNINVNDYSRTEPDPTELLPPHLDAGTGFLLGADTDPAAVRAALVGQPVAVRSRTAGSYPLLVLTPTPPPRHLDKKSWRATASENAELAQRTVDGERRTQWVSHSPGGPALSVTLDLGRPHDLRGVEVRPGLPGRDLRLARSLDGTTWTPIDALTWAGSLYWTGSELLRNGGPKWAVAFPRTSLRYLRLSPATPLLAPWTLAEIDALE